MVENWQRSNMIGSMEQTRKKQIEHALQRAFAPSALEVRDDSHKHAGHMVAAGAGGTHMHVYIRSKAFLGQSRVARHRAVNEVISPFFAEGLHALSIDADAGDA